MYVLHTCETMRASCQQTPVNCKEGLTVSCHTQATDDGSSLGRQVRVVAEGLAGVDVGDVELDEGDLDAGQGILKRDRGVGVGA